MEFKLDKIDTDIRRRLQMENSEDKVHNSKGINVHKDLVEEKKHFKQSNSKDKNENKKMRRYVTIDALKQNERIEIEAEKNEDISSNEFVGINIDTKK